MAVFEWARVTVTDKVNRCKYLNLNFERRNMLVPWDHATSIIEMVFEGLFVFVCISYERQSTDILMSLKN